MLKRRCFLQLHWECLGQGQHQCLHWKRLRGNSCHPETEKCQILHQRFTRILAAAAEETIGVRDALKVDVVTYLMFFLQILENLSDI